MPVDTTLSMMKHTFSSRSNLHLEVELLESADESVGGFLSIGALEMSGTEILPLCAVTQHAPDSRPEKFSRRPQAHYGWLDAADPGCPPAGQATAQSAAQQR